MRSKIINEQRVNIYGHDILKLEAESIYRLNGGEKIPAFNTGFEKAMLIHEKNEQLTLVADNETIVFNYSPSKSFEGVLVYMHADSDAYMVYQFERFSLSVRDIRVYYNELPVID